MAAVIKHLPEAGQKFLCIEEVFDMPVGWLIEVIARSEFDAKTGYSYGGKLQGKLQRYVKTTPFKRKTKKDSRIDFQDWTMVKDIRDEFWSGVICEKHFELR